MSDSGFTQFPQGPRAPGSTAFSSGSDLLSVRLLRASYQLQNVASPERLQGEVIEIRRPPSEDGRDNGQRIARIRTHKGTLEVRIPQGQNAPTPGARVDIEIPPGDPPERVNIRPARPTVQTQQPAEPRRNTDTPVDLRLNTPRTRPAADTAQPIQTPRASTTPQPPGPQGLPAPGSLARFLPLPSTQLSPNVQTPNVDIQTVPLPPLAQFLTTPPVAPPPEAPLAIPLTTVLQQLPPPQILQFFLPAIEPPAHPPQITQLNSFFTNITAPPPQIPTAPILTTTPTTQPIPQPLPQTQSFDAQITQITPPQITLQEPGKPALIQPPTNNPHRPAITPQTIQNAITNLGTFTGTITGLTPENLPIISFAIPGNETSASFILQAPAPDAIPGTTLQITPQPGALTTALPALPPLGDIAALLPLIAPEPWPVMNDIQQTLARAAPAAAQAFSNIVPAPANPAQMGPAALFFLAAIRAGDLGQWLGGRASDILRREGGNLLSRLTQDGQILNRIEAEPLSQNWRALNLPVLYQDQIHKMAVYYKRDDQGGDNKDPQSPKPVRFIFNLSLSRMGPVQLDGLLRAKRLDLILRTETPFSQNLQQDMRRVYTTAIQQTDFTGELSFQNSIEQWVKINAKDSGGFTSNI